MMIRDMTASNTSTVGVAQVGAFNPFYTRQLGLLDEHLLASEFSLAEVRVLFELANRNGLSAATLVRELGINAGYMSRIVSKLQARGLLKKAPAASDGRPTVLALRAKGSKAFAPLEAASRGQVQQLLAPLRPAQTQELLRAMQRIEALFCTPPASKKPYLLSLLAKCRWVRIGRVLTRRSRTLKKLQASQSTMTYCGLAWSLASGRCCAAAAPSRRAHQTGLLRKHLAWAPSSRAGGS
jgi:DNA-binding MarR family transcriptional regulator